MHITLLTTEYEEPYTTFLLSQKTSLFYHSIKYKNFLEDVLGCTSEYLLALKDTMVVGALPLMVKNGPLGKVINSLPYYGSHGGILGDTVPSEAIELFKEKLALLDYASFTLISAPTHDSIDKLNMEVTDQRISQITPLDPHANDKEAYLLSIIESTTRRNINKAKYAGITVCIQNGQALTFLEKIHKENMTVIGGKAKSHDFFVKIPHYFKENVDYKVYIAKKDDINIAALLVFYFNKTVEYFIPVIKHGYRDQQPLALILFEAIKDAMIDGYRFWNWGGTWFSQSGVYQFKKKWGALENIYNYSTNLKNKRMLDENMDMLTSAYEGFYIYNFNNMRVL